MNKKDLNEFKAFTSFWFTVTIFAPRFCTPVAIFQMLLLGDKLSQITIFLHKPVLLKKSSIKNTDFMMTVNLAVNLKFTTTFLGQYANFDIHMTHLYQANFFLLYNKF